MTDAFLILLLISAIFVVAENDIVKMIIYMDVFSLISSVCFLLFAAPDVAMAEAVISTFATIVFIVAFEKYYSIYERPVVAKERVNLIRFILPAGFTICLAALFIWFTPNNGANTYLKDQYTALFIDDVGGENAVTAIYLGYRMYDTLFEALMLFVSIIAIVHLSWHQNNTVPQGKPSYMSRSDIAYYAIRAISPALVLFGIYLVMNGHISPGGGFQGGVMIAAFFAGRYMIYHIYDIPIAGVVVLEKLIYMGIILLSALFIFNGAHAHFPALRPIYPIIMNALIGIKVACGFIIIFYRFIGLERR